MDKKLRHSAFTLCELLVVIIIIVILMALFLPVCRTGHREAHYRASCLNNLKNIGLAMQNYHDVFKSLPIGATGTPGGGWGTSWWLAILPEMVQTNISYTWDYGQISGAPIDHGWPAETSAHNVNLISEFQPDFMICPSSPLPAVRSFANPNTSNPSGSIDVCMPSYVGIMGADDTNMVEFTNQSPSTTGTVSLDGRYGMVSTGGLLLVNDSVSMEDCTDGTSNTMIVSEVSNYFDFTNTSTRVASRVRRDAGWREGGWIAGSDTDSDIHRSISVDNMKDSQVTGNLAIYNLNVVRYQPGQKKFITGGFFLPGKTGYKGADRNDGPNLNTPFVSAHRDGFSCVFLDGSTHYLRYDIDFQVLLRIVTRHDNLSLGNDF